MNPSQLDYSQIIIDTINSLFSNLFSSIDSTLYSLLDKLVFIDTSLIYDSFFDKAFGSTYGFGLLAITDSLFLGIILYYCYRLIIANYTGQTIERPYTFFIRAIIFGICINCSKFLCQQIIYLNSLLSDSIREIGTHIYGTGISFNNFINQINNFIQNSSSFNLFSFEGIMKSFITFGLINLLFSYSLRYVLIKIFVLLSPFAFLSLINVSTSWFFKVWIKNFLSMLLLQSLISLIFLLIFSFDGTFSSTFSQLLYIGAIYSLSKANNYMRELVGGISNDITLNINSLKSLFKNY